MTSLFFALRKAIVRLQRIGVLVRQPIFWLAIVTGLGYALALLPDTAPGNSSTYIIQAKSIATGQGYKNLHIPGEPPETLHPPGLSLLLAGAFVLFPDFPENLCFLVALSGLWIALCAPLVYVFFTHHTRLARHSATLIALLVGFNPVLLYLSAQSVYSEASYLFCSLMALFLLEGLDRTHNPRSARLVFGLLMAITAYYLRVPGLMLYAAIVLYFLWHKRFKFTLIAVLLFVLLAAPWVYRNVSLGASPTGGYDGLLAVKVLARPDLGPASPADVTYRVLDNVWGHATEIILRLLVPSLTGGGALATWLGRHELGWLAGAIGLAMSGVVLLGLIVHLRHKIQLFDIYVTLYMALVLLAPWHVERNLVPVILFLLYYLVLGAQWVAVRIQPLLRRFRLSPIVVTIAALTILLLGALVSDRHTWVSAANCRAGIDLQPGVTEVYNWISINAPADALLMTDDPDKLYLYTGRQGLAISQEVNTAVFIIEAEQAGVDYIIYKPGPEYEYSQYNSFYLSRVLSEQSNRLVRVYETSSEPKAIVYRIISE